MRPDNGGDEFAARDGARMNLSAMSALELLRLHAASIGELRQRGYVRTANNPLGDYTEALVARAMGLELEANSAAGFDAVGPDGVRYQIKGRRLTASNGSRQLSAIRNLAAKDFDVLIAVVFNEQFEVLEAWSIPHEVIDGFAGYREHVNAHVLHVRGALLKATGVCSVAEKIREVSL